MKVKRLKASKLSVRQIRAISFLAPVLFIMQLAALTAVLLLVITFDLSLMPAISPPRFCVHFILILQCFYSKKR